MSIIVNNLKHIYSKNGPFERVAIEDISFTINDGEFIGLIGHTGSGKSTLIEHLNGLLKADSGQIIIDGVDITDKNCKLFEIRSRVGLVFQYPEYQLFEETVYKDIAYGPSNMKLSDEEVQKRVFQAAQFVGLDSNVMQCSPFDLSGGQKRRVAIAGVLAMEPKVLILDEPTAGLDPAGRNDLLARLKFLHKEKGITIILVSHSMEDIADTVEKVMVMSKGRLVAFDTINNIFTKTKLLKGIGLDIPQICQVIDFLKTQGHSFPKEVCSVEDTANIIFEILKGAHDA